MADSLTVNYSWTMPEEGGSPDTWGAKLNSTIVAIDARMFANANAATSAQNAANAAAAVASAALPASSYTAADVFNKVLSRHGSGSGLNADLVDNYHASDLLNSSNQNAGTLPIARVPGNVLRNGYSSGVVTVSSAAPTGGNDGDIWLRI